MRMGLEGHGKITEHTKKDSRSACDLRDHTDTTPYTHKNRNTRTNIQTLASQELFGFRMIMASKNLLILLLF